MGEGRRAEAAVGHGRRVQHTPVLFPLEAGGEGAQRVGATAHSQAARRRQARLHAVQQRDVGEGGAPGEAVGGEKGELSQS